MNAAPHAVRHALGWLVLANLAGLLLSLLLLRPGLGLWLDPLAYGRWYPVHTHGHLYGWCSLPLIALLFHVFRVGGRLEPWGRGVMTLWTAALLAVCGWFLAGHSSGKLFTEFTPGALAPLALALAGLWVVLALAFWEHRREVGWLIRAALLAGLALVPLGLLWASLPGTFPPVNPRSGGATGHNLLVSNLVLLPILAGLPRILGVSRVARGVVSLPLLVSVYLGGWLVWAVMGHGHAPNDSFSQIAGLCSMLPWAVLLPLYWTSHEWTPAERSWLFWAMLWWVLLVVSGCVLFFPFALDQFKFTNGLVAHTHLAMGGFLSAFLLVVCLRLGASPARQALAGNWPRRLWNSALAAQVAVLAALGWNESAHPSWIFFSSVPADTAYAVRSLAGAAQLAASLAWAAPSCLSRLT